MENKVIDLNKYRNRWEEIFRHEDDDEGSIRIFASPKTSEIQICHIASNGTVTNVQLPMIRGVGLMMSLENFFENKKVK